MEEKIIYLAGLFDGEGCVTYKQRLEHRKGKRTSLFILADKIRNKYD